jgi:hypothetical protein
VPLRYLGLFLLINLGFDLTFTNQHLVAMKTIVMERDFTYRAKFNMPRLPS